MKPGVQQKFSADAKLWAALYDERSNRGPFRYNNKIYRFKYVIEGIRPVGGEKKTALDAGCGAGQFLPILARLGYRPTGVDIAGPMVEAARRLCREAGVDATVLQGNCLRLDCEEESFDLCIAVGFLEHQSDEDAALAELARVIRSGGRLIITARNKVCPYVRWRLGAKALVRSVRGFERPYESKEHTPWFLDALLGKHGFTPVKRRYSHFHLLPYPLDISRLQACCAKPMEYLNSTPLGIIFASTLIVYADKRCSSVLRGHV